jgi:deoxyribodipyrimidine photo-lyase
MDLPEGPRIRVVNQRPVVPAGRFVLYWMIAARRPSFNYALDRAVAWAEALQRPLLIFEPLRVDYPWASDRLHKFVIDGMRDNAAAFAAGPALYYPYVEPARGAGKGLLSSLAREACLVVTDEWPCFFLPQMVSVAGQRVTVRLEAVDSSGLLPLRSTDRAYTAAVHFRRHVQKELRAHLVAFPAENPLSKITVPRLRALPSAVSERWPSADAESLNRGATLAAGLPIDHAVPVAPIEGGTAAAGKALQHFVRQRLDQYHRSHNHPDEDGTSRLSPFLHFGHIAPHQVFNAIMQKERWSGVGPGAEAFLDQLVVWRELAYNTCWMRPDDYDKFDALPRWALDTLARHAVDRRPVTYTVAQLENAETHDPLWNAAQRQLRREGWFHNYLRMLWGKKILEWSPTPQDALHAMRTIMDRWSLDGRDPNSYAGYFWTLGRYDRPWPERAIYGTVRSMSSESTRKKVKVKEYLRRFGPDAAQQAPRQGSLLPAGE